MEVVLHPAVQHLLHSGQYACRPRVEIFAEHEIYDKDGKVVRKIDKASLEKDAEKGNKNAEVGNLSLAGPGHTVDDEYDKAGKLTRKVPETEQPKPWGAYHNYSVALNQATGKYSLYADEYVQKKIHDPQTGREVDGLTHTATFPRRSAEIYHAENWIDWVASLRRAPRLAMGISMHAKSDPEHAFYSAKHIAVACDMGNPAARKTRYAIDTRGAGMDEEMADPTAMPTAENEYAAGEQAGIVEGENEAGGQGAGLGGLPTEHMEAAEKYSMHSSGMHHTRMAAILQRMHGEHGMEGDMMTPHTPAEKNAMLSGSNGALPGAATGAAPPLAPSGAPKASPKESEHARVPPKEHAKMSANQEAVEKTRYEMRIADLEKGLAEERAARLVSDEQAQHTRYQQELAQLHFEGFEIDVAAEFAYVTDPERKYSKKQFDDHLALLRRLPRRIDHDVGVIESPTRPYNHQAHGAQDDSVMPEDFNKYQRAIRQGMDEPEAREKYMKSRNGALNGSAK